MDIKRLNGKSILLVDDEIALIELIEESLISHGCVVEKATSGLQALTLSKHKIFDFIISDIQMPVFDGMELLKTLKIKDKPTTRFIFLTGKFKIGENQLKGMGASDLIHKPFDFNRLMDTLMKYC